MAVPTMKQWTSFHISIACHTESQLYQTMLALHELGHDILHVEMRDNTNTYDDFSRADSDHIGVDWQDTSEGWAADNNGQVLRAVGPNEVELYALRVKAGSKPPSWHILELEVPEFGRRPLVFYCGRHGSTDEYDSKVMLQVEISRANYDDGICMKCLERCPHSPITRVKGRGR